MSEQKVKSSPENDSKNSDLIVEKTDERKNGWQTVLSQQFCFVHQPKKSKHYFDKKSFSKFTKNFEKFSNRNKLALQIILDIQ
jgi:hypothetical protein